MALTQQLIVSETFYSIQGEGPSVGHPAVFLRLTGCNLRCQGFSYVDPSTQEHLGCDTAAVWRHGNRMMFDEILKQWQQLGWLTALTQGAHLVVTGGEPMLQQTALINFILELDKRLDCIAYLELETNATLPIKPELLQRLNQINASPKLSSNGDPRSQTYHPEILAELAKHDKVKFKFVVQTAADVEQIISDYVQPFSIDNNKIWLMPEGGTRQRLQETAKLVVELCKTHLFNYTHRLQVSIWDQVVGV